MTEIPEIPSQNIIQERVKSGLAVGSPAPLIAFTDSMGFFIFLGLATVLP